MPPAGAGCVAHSDGLSSSILYGSLHVSGAALSQPNHLQVVLAHLLRSVLQSALGIGLVYFAPELAKRWCSGAESAEHKPTQLGPGDLYRMACLVMGLGFISSGIAAVRTAVAGFQGHRSALVSDPAGSGLPGGGTAAIVG